MLFVLCSIAAAAQERGYHPFCEEGKVWTKDYFNALSNKWYHNTTKLEGDTLIGGKHCMKVYANNIYRGAFFEEEHHTFFINPDDTELKLVYDFSLQVGDQIETTILHTNQEQTLTVTAVDEVKYGNNTTKRLTLKSDNGRFEWIEGVGHKYGPLQKECYSLPGSVTSLPIGLCSVKGQFVYWADETGVSQKEKIPFVAENKHWLVNDELTNGTMHYLMQGDTIIAGQTAKRMFCDEEYLGAFYSKGRLTYFIPKGTETAHLYYNFSLSSAGEQTTVWHDGQYAQIYRKGIVMDPGLGAWGGRLFFMYIEDGDQSIKDTFSEMLSKVAGEWSDGIGSLRGPMNNWIHPLEEKSQTLLACWTPDEIIYDPNGLVAAHFTTITSAPAPTPTYDLSGRKVAPNAHSIYIEAGKKVVR